METIDYFIIAGGVYNLLLALSHMGFWRLFRWKEELPKMSFINRGVIQLLNIHLTIVFLVGAFIAFF